MNGIRMMANIYKKKYKIGHKKEKKKTSFKYFINGVCWRELDEIFFLKLKFSRTRKIIASAMM